MIAALLIFVCWLIGSIPFSYLIARSAKRIDIRKVGSGNVGATNVLRYAGRRAGAAALVLDGLKGWGAVFFARLVTASDLWTLSLDDPRTLSAPTFWIGLAAFAAVVGHMFPPWLSFRGGKGVATGAGAYLGINPAALGLSLVVFLIAVAATRFVAIGSMLASVAFPLFLRFLTGGTFWEIVFSVAIALLVVIRHRTNIARIAAGTEKKYPFERDEP